MTGNWDASKHPRNEKGEFTFKNGGSVSNGHQSDEEKLQNRAELLYSSMDEKTTTNPQRNNIKQNREDILASTIQQKERTSFAREKNIQEPLKNSLINNRNNNFENPIKETANKELKVYEYNTDYKPIHDTYRDILLDENTYAGKGNIDGFKPFYTNTNSKTGFYGRAYINPKTKTVVIGYKGTDTLDITKDWGQNNLPMKFLKKVPIQFQDAENFYFEVRDKLGSDIKNYKIDFAGYSLGGSLAQLMGAKYGNDTVTFNAFGTKQLKNIMVNFTDNIINYGNMNDRTFKDSKSLHIGKFISIKKKHQKETNRLYNIRFHYLENIGNLKERVKQ
ncbi:hypothetical protein II906_00260 [bacterium]|nr:hypothetical protein [bacterium]